VREADELVKKAAAQAWSRIESRLHSIEAEAGRKVELVSVAMDTLPGDSVIEELPEVPKSSRPGAVPVTVRLRATYKLK
jgi:hypothetical protein